MTQTVCDVGDEVQVSSLRAAKQTVNRSDDSLDDINVLPLVETSDILGLGNLSDMEDGIDGTGMIYDIEPVAHVLPLTIYRQRLAMADIVDEEGNQLLRELIRAVVITAVGNDSGHTIGIMESTDEMV